MFRYLLNRAPSRPGASWKVAASGVALTAFMACTQFAPGSDELTDPALLSQRQQPEARRDWSCLGEALGPEPLVNSPAGATPLAQPLRVNLLVGGGVPQGVTARACPARDVNCVGPITPAIPFDSEGRVYLPLYEGFDGYIEIAAAELVPVMLFFTDPLRTGERVDDDAPFSLVERALLPTLSEASGLMLDEELGLVFLRTSGRSPPRSLQASANQPRGRQRAS